MLKEIANGLHAVKERKTVKERTILLESLEAQSLNMEGQARILHFFKMCLFSFYIFE